MAEQSLDILIKLAVEGDASARQKIEQIKQQTEALTNTGAGLASSPGKFAAEQGKRLELTAQEAEAAEKTAQRLRNLIAIKKALGEEYSTEAEKLLQLNRAIEASALATKREDDAERSLTEAMTRGREASERRVASQQAEMQAAQQSAIATAAQAKGKTDLTERTKEVAKAEDRRKEGLADAIRANVADEKSTKDGTQAKLDYREALKGVALEIPHLGQALRLLASPLSLLGAAAGVGIQQISTMLEHLEEAGRLSRAFGTRNDRIDPMSVIRENSGRDRDAVRQQIAGLDAISRQAQQAKLALEMRGSLASREAEVKLAEKLEQIQTALARGEIKEADAIRQRTVAQREAREATEAAALVEMQRQSAGERLDSSRQTFKASKEEESANA